MTNKTKNTGRKISGLDQSMLSAKTFRARLRALMAVWFTSVPSCKGGSTSSGLLPHLSNRQGKLYLLQGEKLLIIIQPRLVNLG